MGVTARHALFAASFRFNGVHATGRDEHMVDVAVGSIRHVMKDSAACQHQLIEFFANCPLATQTEPIITPYIQHPMNAPTEDCIPDHPDDRKKLMPPQPR